MRLKGFVDCCEPFCIHGWAIDEEDLARPLRVHVRVNGETVGDVPARVFRHDLAPFGGGCKAFWFNPYGHLRAGSNTVEVVHADTGRRLQGGFVSLRRVELEDAAASEGGQRRAQRRWREVEEPEASLTWGAVMTGDSFIDEVAKYAAFSDRSALLEVGPGYGRLLKTLLARRLPLRSYLGLEISPHRTRRLEAEFGSERVRFACGDVARDAVGHDFDLVISSATFEHLCPDFTRAAIQLREQLASDGWVFVDFIQQDPDLLVAHAYFEDAERGGAFIRVYSRTELIDGFAAAGLRVVDLSPIALGSDVSGALVRRIFVAAQRA